MADTQLDRLDHALGRMASGLYPSCEACGQRIAMDALRADPARTLCSACEAQPGRPAP